MRISDSYKRLNKQLHHSRPDYGVSGHKWAGLVKQISEEIKAETILDYGCGKRTLEEALGFPIRNYDPAIEGFDGEPSKSDLVVCTDVLEHIEPENLDEVLDHLRQLTLQRGIFVIATRPAQKVLPDGRNAHLIVESFKWWLPKLWDQFVIRNFTKLNEGEFLVIVS